MSKSKSKDPSFQGMPPIWRLNRPWLFTEKLDGTNGLIAIRDDLGQAERDGWPEPLARLSILDEGTDQGWRVFGIWAGSKNRWLAIGQDNYGFAKWVLENHASLVQCLGPGLHRGEWWGGGIQHGYGLAKDDKRFSLFNVSRWTTDSAFLMDRSFPDALLIHDDQVPGLGVVPYLGSHDRDLSGWVTAHIIDLRNNGSKTVPGFMRPEGIVAFQPSSLISFKVTLENDGIPKSLVAK